MPQNKIEILIIADGKKAHATLVTTGKDVKQLGDATKQADTKTSGFGKSVLSLQSALSALGLGAVVAQTINFATESFKAAAAAERLGAATNNLAEGIGSTGDQMVNAITAASLETISKTDAMTAANKAMMFGLVENSDQMARLTEVAVTLGAAMGQDAGKSMDDLTTALGRQSPMILDNLGITLKLEEAYKIYAAQLGKTVDALTEQEKKQAFVTAALIKGEERVKELGGVTLDSAGKTEQLSAAWSDFTVAFGGLMTQMSGGIQTLTAFIRKLEEGAEAWQYVFGQALPAIQEYNIEMMKADEVTAETVYSLTGSTAALAAMGAEEEQAAQYARMYAQSMQGLAEAQIQAKDSSITLQAATEETNEAIQSSTDIYAMTGEAATQHYKEIGEAAMAAAEKEKEALRSVANESASFYLSLRELQQGRLEDEAEFSSQLAGIQSSAAEKTKEQATALSEELAKIEQERADKLHWVMTGAHARTEEENAAALAHWNTHYDELKATAETKTREKTDAILAEQGRAEAAAKAARDKEKAEYQKHLDDLKIKTALSMLETTGQLEQLTGLVGISAGEAADLISAGVLPVTQQLGVAMQDTLGNLESNMEAAASTATANQDIIQGALAGTLGTMEELGTSTTANVTAAVEGFGTQLPASINSTNQAATAFTTNTTAGMQTMMTEAVMPFDEEIVLLTEEKIPMLESVYLQAMLLMQEATQQLTSLVLELGAALAAAQAAAERMAKALVDGMKEAKGAIKATKEELHRTSREITEQLVPAILLAIEAFNEMTSAANAAAHAAQSVTHAAVEAGVGFQHGTPPGGFLVPPSYGTDEFMARFSGGERIFAYPNDRVPSRQQTTNYYFNQTINPARYDGATAAADFRTAQILLGA